MTEEEVFKKNFPQFCTEKGECLSPFYDVFEAGVELATAELNKGIIQSLTKENAELKAQIEKMKVCGNCAKYNSGYGESPCKLFASGICGEWETSIGKF